ncbi:hypothetical protein [uncultured Methanocorpusculum sp.]|nr:hypothetical protein [uncultured Methanocorpusculum sp.]
MLEDSGSAFAAGDVIAISKERIEDSLYAQFGFNETSGGTQYLNGWYPSNPSNIGKAITIELITPDGSTVLGKTKTVITA